MNVMLPMTFPVEAKCPRETEARVKFIIGNAMTEPGPFFSNLSLAAAHKVILRPDLIEYDKLDDRVVPDPELFAMKSQAIQEMKRKLRNPETAADEAAFETVLYLITAAVSAFPDAQIWQQVVSSCSNC